MRKQVLLLIVASFCAMQNLSAQEQRKFEVGASASFGFTLGQQKDANNYGFDVFGGYKVSKHFSIGAGVNYVNYAQRYLPSNIENVAVLAHQYRAFRPYIYGRYDFLPQKKWTPYVGLKAGYAFFSNSAINYVVNPMALSEDGTFFGYGTPDLSEYEYLSDLDHTLGVKGNAFATLDLGASLHVGKKGSKFNFGAFLDLQPVKYTYNNTTATKFNVTAGPKIGFTF